MAPSQQDVSLLLQHLNNPSCIDETTREKVIEACQDVIASLETPLETARRSACLTLDHAVIRTAIQLNLFKLLAAGNEPRSTADLAAATTPPHEPATVSRVLRYLASPLRLVVEHGPDRWAATPRASVLADPSFNAGCSMYFDSGSSAFQALPPFLSTDGQTAVSPFEAGLPGQGGFFPWLQKDSSKLQAFHIWMETLASFQNPSQRYVNFSEWIPDKLAENDVAFLDVGGGTGGQAAALREARGTQPGRIIVQDREEVVHAIPAELLAKNVEAMAHDFLTEQPIKGASIYYFRHILHDWPESDCVNILNRTVDAMTDSSTVLIDESVLPDSGAHWMVTQHDLTMLAFFNAAERSEAGWRALLAKCGLQIVEIRCYDKRTAACIIVARLATGNSQN